MGQTLPDSLTQAALAGVGPLTIQLAITSVIILTTNVFGESRDSARVDIYFGSVMMYSVTVTQALPQATLPFDLVSGGVEIYKGGFFFLTLPAGIQYGSVFSQITFSSSTSPAPTEFSGYAAHWTATSLVEPPAALSGSDGKRRFIKSFSELVRK